MKAIIFTFTTLLFLNSCAQDRVKGNGNIVKETRSIGNFDEIETGGNYDVYVYDAPQNGKLTIEGESNVISAIETEVSGNKLTIKKKKGFNLSNTKNVKISVNAQNLKSIAVSGSGSLVAEGVQKVDNFSAALSGSGGIKVKIQSENASIATSGSGDLNISGKTHKTDIAISGSADVDASDLESDEVSVGVSGSGNSKVWATNSLEGGVSGSGDIFYKGNPNTVNVHSSGSGKISKL